MKHTTIKTVPQIIQENKNKPRMKIRQRSVYKHKHNKLKIHCETHFEIEKGRIISADMSIDSELLFKLRNLFQLWKSDYTVFEEYPSFENYIISRYQEEYQLTIPHDKAINRISFYNKDNIEVTDRITIME